MASRHGPPDAAGGVLARLPRQSLQPAGPIAAVHLVRLAKCHVDVVEHCTLAAHVLPSDTHADSAAVSTGTSSGSLRVAARFVGRYTGHITAGGSVCLPQLAPQGQPGTW